jgi:hypothetical protein
MRMYRNGKGSPQTGWALLLLADRDFRSAGKQGIGMELFYLDNSLFFGVMNAEDRPRVGNECNQVSSRRTLCQRRLSVRGIR